MTRPRQSDDARWAMRLYRAALLLYPRAHRERFGDEMTQVFRGAHRRARARGGAITTGAVVVRFVLDVCAHGARERVMAWSPSTCRVLAYSAVALALGAVTGWLDVHNSEVQVAVGCLLVFGFGLGFTSPRLWWLGWLLLGLCVPAAIALTLLLGGRTAYPSTWSTATQSFLALIPALIGVGAGAMGRLIWGARRPAAG